jgi:hypothetical protein
VVTGEEEEHPFEAILSGVDEEDIFSSGAEDFGSDDDL